VILHNLLQQFLQHANISVLKLEELELLIYMDKLVIIMLLVMNKKKIDVMANEIFKNLLKNSGKCCVLASEEEQHAFIIE